MSNFKNGFYDMFYPCLKYRFQAILIIFNILLFIFGFSISGNAVQNTYIYNKDVGVIDKLQDTPVNNPPQVFNLRILDASTGQQFASGRPYTGDRLRAEYDFQDIDGDVESNSTLIKWYKNGTQVTNEVSRILTQTVRKGERWYFTVTPHDGKGYGDIKASGEVIIQNAPPSIGYARILPMNPSAKDDLTADYTYFDPEGDPQSRHEIRWYKDNILQGFYNDAKKVPAYDGTRPVKK